MFLLQLMLTFVVGSVWIFVTLIVSSRGGSKRGGFIGGLPSTALLSFFFIGLSQSPQAAAAAATVFPLAYGATALFLVTFAAFHRRGFAAAISLSLAVWFLMSFAVAALRPTNYPCIVAAYALILAIALYVIEFRLGVVSRGRPQLDVSDSRMAMRSILAGCVITTAVLLAKLGGPVFGGIFAAFPAMFISTLALTYRAFGIEFSRAMTKPLMITGMITIVIYSAAVRYFYVNSGLYLGTLLALIVSAVSAYFTLLFMRRKMS